VHPLHPADRHAAAHAAPHEEAVHGEAMSAADKIACSGAGSVAVGLFSTTCLVPWVFSLIMYGGIVSKLTWRFVDFFTSVFLAILWFGAFNDIFTLSFFTDYASPLVIIILQVFVLYFLAMFIAYQLKDNQFRLVTFASCGAHYVAFAGIASGEHVQRKYFAEDVASPFIFVAIAIAAFAAVFYAVYQWRGKRMEDKFNHVVDELELDIAGLVGSYLITQSVRTLLTGHYPAPHLFFLQEDPHGAEHAEHGHEEAHGAHGEHGHHETHTQTERWTMFGWACFLVASCIYLVPKLHRWGHQGLWQHRFAHFVKVAIIMSAAWAFLLWGEWEFHASFSGDPLFGKMVFALLGTAVALSLVMAVAYTIPPDDQWLLQAAELGITGLGLVAAWSWEHCFDKALETIAKEYQVGYGGLVPKLTLAILVPMFVLPVYVNYVKPQVVKIEEEEEEETEKLYGSSHGTPRAH